MMYGYGSGVGLGLGGWLGILGMIALVIGVILLVAWLLARVAPATHGQVPQSTQGQVPQSTQTPVPPAAQDALELLRMRFARGEITADEYRAARQVLEEGR
jgi:uncharacterized membrane protein